MNRPVAVLISDIHYNIQTLEVADKALRMAVDTANRLGVPLIIAGDLHDTKANIRGECIKAIIDTIRLCKVWPNVIVGNHDKINEKSSGHSLNFLEAYARIINEPEAILDLKLTLFPYCHDATQLIKEIKLSPPGHTVIMHQGVIGSEGGHYIQDKSALGKNDLAGFRVISGHYHIRQSFELPEGGRFDYLGNPYTLSFGEASHPEKGFQVLYDDGSLEFIPTNLRRHIIINAVVESNNNLTLAYIPNLIKNDDNFWVKLTGPSDKLNIYSKNQIKTLLRLTQDFRLDLIPTDTTTYKIETSKDVTQVELLDNLIDSLTNTDDNRKIRLKELWKQLK